MLKKIAMASAFVLAMSVPALADSNCSDPIAPAALDGATATKDQMSDAHKDVVNFIKASDDYQECMSNEYKAVKDKAEHDKKPLDPSVLADYDAKVDASQSLKEKVGAEFNAAVMAYKAKHP